MGIHASTCLGHSGLGVGEWWPKGGSADIADIFSHQPSVMVVLWTTCSFPNWRLFPMPPEACSQLTSTLMGCFCLVTGSKCSLGGPAA